MRGQCNFFFPQDGEYCKFETDPLDSLCSIGGGGKAAGRTIIPCNSLSREGRKAELIETDWEREAAEGDRLRGGGIFTTGPWEDNGLCVYVCRAHWVFSPAVKFKFIKHPTSSVTFVVDIITWQS